MEDKPPPTEPIENYYELSKVIGKGFFAVVCLGIDKKTAEEVAIKCILKPKVNRKENLESEISILRSVDHPHIVKLISIFETDDKLFIVMDLMRGGELYEEIIKRNVFSEKQASHVIGQLFSALSYIHKLGIVHRDLKLENLLLSQPGELEIKLADFGLSKVKARGDSLLTACGTPFYVAPDVLLGTGYDSSVDLWGAGIILYILLSGRLPFAAESEKELFTLIVQCQLIWKTPQFDNISESAKDLISKLIIANPSVRFTADQALEHSFIKDNNSISEEPLHPSFVENLKHVSALSKASLEKALSSSSSSSGELFYDYEDYY